MTESGRVTPFVTNANEARVPEQSGAGRKKRPGRWAAWCVLFAFINLDVLYPMQQAMAAEWRSELDTAVRDAHVDALGDTLALASHVGSLQEQQLAQAVAAPAVGQPAGAQPAAAAGGSKGTPATGDIPSPVATTVPKEAF